MVVTTIIIGSSVMGVAIFSSIRNGGYSDDMDYSYINPQFETARQQRKIAEELKRQNDLMERRMNERNPERE